MQTVSEARNYIKDKYNVLVIFLPIKLSLNGNIAILYYFTDYNCLEF